MLKIGKRYCSINGQVFHHFTVGNIGWFSWFETKYVHEPDVYKKHEVTYHSRQSKFIVVGKASSLIEAVEVAIKYMNKGKG